MLEVAEVWRGVSFSVFECLAADKVEALVISDTCSV